MKHYFKRGVPFWGRVDTSSEDGCWPWLGGKSQGRGHYTYNGRKEKAYRVAWMLTHGPIPEGMFICHHCDNPTCVRPDHLFLGTHADNMRDMKEKGRYCVPNLRGEKCSGGRAFPDALVEEARRLYATGQWTQAELGKKFGVSPTTVSRWVRGTSRGDSGGPRVFVGRGQYRDQTSFAPHDEGSAA